jgi:hypothetical protein
MQKPELCFHLPVNSHECFSPLVHLERREFGINLFNGLAIVLNNVRRVLRLRSRRSEAQRSEREYANEPH